MTEYNELGKLLKLKKEQQKLSPKLEGRKNNIRAKRKLRKVTLKKWIITLSEN